jgi:putative transposase
VTAFIDGYRECFGVEPICRTLGVSASAYYQRKTGRRSVRTVQDERLMERIREVHRANYECYGYRRVHAALVRTGETAGRDRIARLMARDGLQGAKRRGQRWRTTSPDPEARRPDLVQRRFCAERPDRLWVGDLTYLSTWQQRCYLAFLLDVYSRRVIGWQLACHMRTSLVLDTVRMALGTREPGADVALVHHTDRGSQYTSADYTQQLTDARVLASVGSVGDAYDNALAESFVDSYKTELIADRVWRTPRELQHATAEYLGWFNHRRLHSALGYRPPAEVEADWHQTRAQTLLAQAAPTPSHRPAAATGLAALPA